MTSRELVWPVALFGLVAGPVIFLGTLTAPFADDFALALILRQTGDVFAYVSLNYQTWYGRVLPMLLTGLTFGDIDALAPVLGSVLGLCFAFVPITLVALARVYGLFPRPAGPPAMMVLAAGALAAMYLGFRPLLASSVYWLTGGLHYVLPTVLALAWLIPLIISLRRPIRRSLVGAWVVLGIPLGTCSEIVSMMLVCAGAVAILVRGRPPGSGTNPGSGEVEPRDRRRAGSVVPAFLGLAAVALGTVLILVAPGNAVRAGGTPLVLELTPTYLLPVYGSVVLLAMRHTVEALTAGLLFGLGLHTFRLKAEGGRIGRWCAVLLSGALGSLIPLAFVPSHLPDRALFPFAVLMFAVLASGVSVVRWPGFQMIGIGGKRVQLAAATAVLAAYMTSMVGDLRAATTFHAIMTERQRELRDPRTAGGEVELAALPEPRAVNAELLDVSPDPTFWVNQLVAEYYGKGLVRRAGRADTGQAVDQTGGGTVSAGWHGP